MSFDFDTVLVAAAATAVSEPVKKVVEEVWVAGRRWTGIEYKEESHETREIAEQHAVSFVTELARRLEELAKDGRAVDATSPLDDPDFASTLKEAVLSSARTSSELKRRVMAGLIAERMLAGPDSMAAMAANQGLHCVRHLTELHLAHLACLSTVYFARPPIVTADVWDEVSDAGYARWWDVRLAPFRGLEPWHDFDALHLHASRVIHFSASSRRTLESVLHPGKDALWEVSTLDPELMEWLEDHWEGRWDRSIPTPAGFLIGAEVCSIYGLATTVMLAG